MKRILTGAAAMRREDRLQQRENRLSTKNADLKAEVERLRKELIGVVAVLSAEVDFIASLTAENERLRGALKEAKDGLRYWEPQTAHGAREMARICALVDAALQPKEEK